MPLRESYQGDDYQVRIISYDSNIMKYQLLVLIHPLNLVESQVHASRLAIPGCCGVRVLMYTVMTILVANECSAQHRLLLFKFLACKHN